MVTQRRSASIPFTAEPQTRPLSQRGAWVTRMT